MVGSIEMLILFVILRFSLVMLWICVFIVLCSVLWLISYEVVIRVISMMLSSVVIGVLRCFIFWVMVNGVF